jgi:monoamine oxidase
MALAGAENPFKAPADWRNPGAADRSAADYLETKGFSEAARRLADVALNANRLETYSMANVWRSLQLFAVDASIGRSGEIASGSQRLPEAMAASLGDLVRMNSPVRSVGTDAAGVEIATAKGTHSADFCILALPFPALRNIALSPAPTGAQKAAIEALPYTQITQLHLAPQTRFWESDGWPAAMWTDGPLERVFPVKDRTDGSVVGFNAWINGWRAAEIAMKDEAALETLAQTEFARLRPASAGKLRLLKAVRWTRESYAGGAYMHWAPGQIADWADEMAAPIGRIHFAGEHLSSLHTGMEGAMEAGHRAALDIMSRAG